MITVYIRIMCHCTVFLEIIPLISFLIPTGTDISVLVKYIPLTVNFLPAAGWISSVRILIPPVSIGLLPASGSYFFCSLFCSLFLCIPGFFRCCFLLSDSNTFGSAGCQLNSVTYCIGYYYIILNCSGLSGRRCIGCFCCTVNSCSTSIGIHIVPIPLIA